MKLPTLPRRLFRRRPKQFRYPNGIPRVLNFEIRVNNVEDAERAWRRIEANRREHG
ncbi:hypothetical protein SEA_LUCHADOR_43 [Mycobacterium phage Luchador]|uniref:Uncharacterized protein n=1 Tax=Mycobacterium phage Luchador TaxID=1647300 RepID=A0A0F6SJH1_9CAUD|nr:hypothetical protein AVT52_gp61 [Mycobacterium phage Luchador]AKF14207.1 hypothetical protein SEA_LUCHADOR_43 [Mycobacterium phage Luchador]